MNKLFRDDLKGGLLLGIIATLCMFIPSMALIGAIIGFFGFRKSKRAVKSGKMLGLELAVKANGHSL